MNRWRSRLAKLQNDIEEALPVQNVQNVQKSDRAVGFEHFEQFEQRRGLVLGTAKPWSDAEEERAAIAEYDGGAPRAWAEALARLDPNKPAGDVPPAALAALRRRLRSLPRRRVGRTRGGIRLGAARSVRLRSGTAVRSCRSSGITLAAQRRLRYRVAP
jgi:hypothetical protein